MKRISYAVISWTLGFMLMSATVNAGAQPRHSQARGPAVGHQVRFLPRGHVTVSVGSAHYHYHNGVFYRPHGAAGYVVVNAPIGVRVRTLPAGYVSFGIGARHYFFVNATYYLWDSRGRDYVVVEEPRSVQQAMTTEQEPSSTELFAYPNEGQSTEQTQRDRYECHLWSANESGYDPSYGNQRVELLDDYNRASTACLVARGYTVR